MQIRDLIEQLQKFDPSADVAVEALTVIEPEDIAEIEHVGMESIRFRVVIQVV
jgi:hypothetical protein